MKVGIVFEGGGMRGLYTCGIIDTFLDNDIMPDLSIGVSAGTLFGVNLYSKQKGRGLRYNKKFARNKNYMSLYSLLTTGNIIGEKLAFHDIPEKYDKFDDEEFKKCNSKFYATITNVDSGKAEYVKLNSVFDDMEVLRATSAMPYVSKMIKINDNKYLDGGIGDSIPVLKAKELGCDKIIVVLTRPFGYKKKPSNKIFSKLYYMKYPNLVDAINNRYKNYNDTLKIVEELENNKEIFVIRPSRLVKIHRVENNPDKLQEMYDLGVEDSNKCLDELKKYLEK